MPRPGAGNPDTRPDYYTVRKGDTLYSIALDYGLDYKELAAWNGVDTNTYVIRIGQRLRLKGPEGVTVTPLHTAGSVEGQPMTAASNAKEESAPIGSSAPRPPSTPMPANPVPVNPQNGAGEQADDNSPGDEADDWAWPARGKIVGVFNDGRGDKGIDIAGKLGSPVYAAAAGKVVYSGSSLRGYGKLIIIKHNKVYLSAYAHNSRILVKEGQTVAKGQEIAEMGNTDSKQIKLHFEIRRYGKPVDPMKFLPSEQNHDGRSVSG